jgi:hypothetical protein
MIASPDVNHVEEMLSDREKLGRNIPAEEAGRITQRCTGRQPRSARLPLGELPKR